MERTRQQLDPVGTFNVRIITVSFSLAAFIYAAATVSIMFDHLSNPSLALIALVVIGAACLVMVRGTDPYRGAFTRRMHGWVVALQVAATALLAASTWSHAHFFSLGWVGPLALGLFYIALSPYRPARELVGFGFLGAVAIGFVTMLQALRQFVPEGSEALVIPPLATIGAVLLPLVALNFASAVFSVTMIERIQRWHRRASEEVDKLSEERQPAIARSVQQDRVTILNREVVPFFAEVLQRKALTDADREQARSIADAIRKVMVAEVDRTWLENLIESLRARVRRDGAVPETSRLVFDDEHVANLMNYDQRTGLRALIVAIFDQSNNRPEELEIVLGRVDGRCQGVIAVRLDLLDGAVKTRFGPYLAVMRVVFRRLQVEYLQSVLTVRFSYEQR